MKPRSWLPPAVVAVAMGAGAAGSVSAVPVRAAFAAGPASALIAAAGMFAWRAMRPAKPAMGQSLAAAVPAWKAGRRGALEGMVAQFAGPDATAHALRCATLSSRLAEQLALSPQETADLVLAAALHVLPVAFPHAEDASIERCEFDSSALLTASSILQRVAPGPVASVAAEVRERWDGTGVPSRLVGEGSSLSGRILAVVCAFDHASTAGLPAGLEAVSGASGTAFDPVVAAELVYLFREPWQHRSPPDPRHPC